MPNALDADQRLTADQLTAARAAGTQAILVYSRLLTAEYAAAISVADMDIVVIAEWGSGAAPNHYNADNGLADAERLLGDLSASAVHPPGIYVCNGDFDASAEQIAGPITDYRRAVKNGLMAAGISAGGYGNGASMAAGLDDGTIVKAFVWAGMGTNGTAAFIESGRWSIRQFPTTEGFGLSIDPDSAQGDYWGFRVPVAAPIAVDEPPASPVSWFTRSLFYTAPMMTGEDVSQAQRLLGISVDGIYGRQTEAAVRSFQQLSGIAADGIIGPQTAQHLSAPA